MVAEFRERFTAESRLTLINPDYVVPIIESKTKELWYEILGEDGNDKQIMTYHVKRGLEIEGIEKIPTQLTLTLKAVTVFYKDGNWKVPIPSPSEK